MNSNSIREDRALLKSVIALFLIATCLWAAQWQFQRGVDRHHRNSLIAQQIVKSEIDLSLAVKNLAQCEFAPVRDRGFFTGDEILLRNHYFEGKYGYEVLSLFKSSTSTYWVDRGWVIAGATATTRPKVPDLPRGEVTLSGFLRFDTSLPQGSFFALPTSDSGLISEVNARRHLANAPFYLQAKNGITPAELPVLSDGPHFAYAVQWLFFAALIGYGRLLIRRGQILASK